MSLSRHTTPRLHVSRYLSSHPDGHGTVFACPAFHFPVILTMAAGRARCAGALVLSVDAHTWGPIALPATLNRSESRVKAEAAAREGSMGSLPVSPARVRLGSHTVWPALHAGCWPGAAPFDRADATPGFRYARGPRSGARSSHVAPGWSPAPTLTQRYNAGNSVAEAPGNH